MPSTRGEHPIVIGVDSFGDMTVGSDGELLSQPQNIRELVAEGVLAEESGLDFFGLGEHHIEEMPLSAPDLVLAAIAARTSRIHLGSAVTVLNSDDPVRVFQRYATLDALSSGRADLPTRRPQAARLPKDHPRVLRTRGHLRLPLRRLSRDRCPTHRQDHDRPRCQPLRSQIRHGPDAARDPHGEHPPLRR